MRLAFLAAAHRAGVCERTLRKYKSDGLHAEMVNGRLFVRLDDVLAWKRYRGLKNAAKKSRREKLAREGKIDARVSDTQFERAFQDWIKAGGKP